MTRQAILFVALISFPVVGGEPAPAKVADSDAQDFVFFQESRPLLLRIHFRVAGRSYAEDWDEVMNRLFRYLDADGDGAVSAKELQAAPSVTQLMQMIQGITDIEADEPPKIADLTSTPKLGVTLAQLKGYYQRVGAAPWQVEWHARTSETIAMDNFICDRLGLSNKALTQEHFKKLDPVLFKLDSDEDGILSLFEISQNGYTGNFNIHDTLQRKGVPFFLLDPSDHGRELLTAAMMQRYDRNKDGKLSPNEIGFSPEVRRRLTGSPDGAISQKQIARWADLPPDLELQVHLEGAGSEGIELQSSKLATAASVTRTGIIRLELPREQIEIVRLDTAPQRARRLKQIGTQLFDSLAGSGDKLMSKDIFRPPFALVPVFRLADRNGDNTLSRAEYQAFLDIQQKLVTRSLVVSLLDRGHSLFDFLDADHDHRLSKRELLTAWDRIAPWADAKTHSIDRERIPHQYQIVIRHGKPEQPEADPGAASAARPESRLRGPIWFRKMDRNADGDVSRAEFLGTDEQFRKLDLNGDGMIDLQEAEAAGRKRK